MNGDYQLHLGISNKHYAFKVTWCVQVKWKGLKKVQVSTEFKPNRLSEREAWKKVFQ